MKKPITPDTHGIVDYVLTGVQAAAPVLLHLNKYSVRTYAALAAGMGVINALTDTRVGIKRRLSVRTHRKADLSLLGAMALLTTLPFVRNHKKALAFHLGFLAISVLHYVLTDYKHYRLGGASL